MTMMRHSLRSSRRRSRFATIVPAVPAPIITSLIGLRMTLGGHPGAAQGHRSGSTRTALSSLREPKVVDRMGRHSARVRCDVPHCCAHNQKAKVV